MKVRGSDANRDLLLKIMAYACLIAATAAIAFASWYWYNPRSFAFSTLDARTGQILLYGGIPLIIGLFSMLAPAPAGILGLLYCLFEVTRFSMVPIPPTPLMPPWIYLPLYGVFASGCILQIVRGLRQSRTSPVVISGLNRGVRTAARVAIIAAMAMTIVVFPFFPLGQAFAFLIMGVIVLSISWFWPGAGGTLGVLLSALAISLLITSNNPSDSKAAWGIVLMIFFCGGILHILTAVRAKWPASVWRPALAIILSAGFMGGVSYNSYADEYTRQGSVPVTIAPPTIVLRPFFGVAPELESKLLVIAQNDPEIRRIIGENIRTLSIGGKPWIDEGYNLAVGVYLKDGVSMVAWTQGGRQNPEQIASYVGSLNVGFPPEENHAYSFSIDPIAGQIYDLKERK